MKSAKAIRFWQKYGAPLAFLVALLATLGSLYYSEIRNFVPCALCWYQRILMYPLVIIILVGIVEQDEFLPTYVLPFSLIGIFVASYHYLIEWGVVGNPTACEVGIPCSVRWVNYFGFISIPFMALTAFILISVVMVAMKWAYKQPAALATAAE
jgi:disulfide bond formation protein DsbB